MDRKTLSIYRHHGDQRGESQTITPESRAIWYRKIEELNKQIEQLVQTRNNLYRILVCNVSEEIRDADYSVLDELPEFGSERDGAGVHRRDFT